MRTLERNKIELFIVEPDKVEDIYDEDGYFTGEKELKYSEPKKIRINLYPVTGRAKEELFGLDNKVAYSSVSMSKFKIGSLLFFDFPENIDYSTEYDLKLTKRMMSINNYRYGFEDNHNE